VKFIYGNYSQVGYDSRMTSKFTSFLRTQRHLIVLMISGVFSWEAEAVILYDTGDPTANTTAPTGIYENSGWSHQGKYGGFLGTMISPQHFITAKHFGTQGGTFISTAAMNGIADITYTIDASANGSIGYWDIGATDLRIFKINETFSSYAQIYTGTSEAGKTLVTHGLGGDRGAEVIQGGDLKGWLHTPSDGTARWGANQVDIVNSSFLFADFDAISGQQEATLSTGDSGGGVFIKIGADWLLAGVNFGVDRHFGLDGVTSFEAAIFDRGGLYSGASLIPDQPSDLTTNWSASRISTSSAEIQSIIAVPERGSLALLLLSAGVCWHRRRLSV
jgi:hypothetical protein